MRVSAPAGNGSYEFAGGYPTPETVRRAYDEADLNRAVQAYRFFYPSVSIMATWKGNLRAGMVENKVFGLLEGTPKQFVFTPNSDTPYSGLPLDVSDGPMVLELPPGPLMSTMNDLNQRWVMDMGLPGPDQGHGGRHLVLPPSYDGEMPEGFNVGRPTTNRVLVLLRALPRGKDMAGAIELMKSVKVYRLGAVPVEPEWVDLTQRADEDFTPVPWEDNLTYWEVLAELISSEPPFSEFRAHYGDLAELGIARGRPFQPDERMRGILTHAAVMGHAQLAAQSFADRRPDRVVWPGTRWEWAVLRPENGTFDTPGLRRRVRPAEMVLPGPDRVTRHVRPRPRGRVAVLALHPGRHGRLSRRRQVLHPGRAATCPGQAVLVADRL